MELALFLSYVATVLLISVPVVRNYLHWYERLDKVYAAGKYKDKILQSSTALFSAGRARTFVVICISSCVLVIASLFLTGITAFRLYIAQSVHSWTSHAGKVTELSRIDRGGPDRDLGKLEYQFKIDNKTYKSNFVRLGRNRDYAWKELASKYPVGKEVAVFASPVHPERSFLEPPDATEPVRNGLLAALLLSAGIALRIWFNSYTAKAEAESDSRANT
jgi:hypothetical protein